MEGVKRDRSVGFEIKLSKLEQHLEDTITALVGKVSREDQPSSSSIHHKTMPPIREILEEEIGHDHSPNYEQLLSYYTKISSPSCYEIGILLTTPIP